MRELLDHKANGLNEAIKITVMDEPGQGGACHHYNISLIDGSTVIGLGEIKFQNGPIKEFGLNGWSQEALLAIVIDRLKSFETGAFACYENAMALGHIATGLMWLQKRTLARGVEGTNVK